MFSCQNQQEAQSWPVFCWLSLKAKLVQKFSHKSLFSDNLHQIKVQTTCKFRYFSTLGSIFGGRKGRELEKTGLKNNFLLIHRGLCEKILIECTTLNLEVVLLVLPVQKYTWKKIKRNWIEMRFFWQEKWFVLFFHERINEQLNFFNFLKS